MRKRSGKAKTEDVNQIAARMTRHLIESTEADAVMSDDDARRALARALGRLGGLKGGKARAAKMSKSERRESASKAARARWEKKSS